MAPAKIAFITKICLVVTAFSFLTVIPSNSAVAFWIVINPGNYSGAYQVKGVATGPRPREVELSRGQHSIVLANANSFRFNVDVEGVVSSQPAATGGDKTLTFNTITIAIDPGDPDRDGYAGKYSLASVDDEHAPGPRTIVLMPGVTNYILRIANANSFRFDVDAKGQIPEADSHQSGDKTLTFKTVPIAIDPGDPDQDGYTGNYSVASVDDEDAPGPRTVVLMPGVTNYILRIANANSFRFDVDANGQIPEADSHQSGNKTLTFNTVRIVIDPDGYCVVRGSGISNDRVWDSM